jgi:hypothetical protein
MVIHLLLAPYLRARTRLKIGPWELIPRGSLDESDTVSRQAFEQVHGLLALYHSPPQGNEVYGCIFKRSGGQVGDTYPRAEMRPLRRALVAAVLDRNPVRDGRGGGAANQGHGVSTSDNGALWGHRVGPEGNFAADYGVMVRTLVGGLRIGDEQSALHPPNELHMPSAWAGMDALYADAVYRCVRLRTETAHRLGRAIDWLDLCWRNTPSVSEETRIVVLKFAFEVLLHAGDSVARQRAGLVALLPELSGRRRQRHYSDRHGNARSEVMADLEWWFSKFTWLRNAIAHGGEVGDSDLRWGRTRHLWVAEARLRAAIKETVAREGYEEVRLTTLERATRAAMRHFGLTE